MTMVMVLTSLLPCGRGRTPASSIAKVDSKVKALKEMEVSTAAATTNTSITNGLGILQFLPGKTCFIAGGTGFLAKAVVEKILRTAPDVGRCFLSTNVLGPSRLMDFTNKYCKILRVFLHLMLVVKQKDDRGEALPHGREHSKEKAASEFPPLSYPVLDVDGEIEIALDSKVAFEGNLKDQKMKALGLERARIHGWHNPYEFTKAMGEMMINSMRGDIPLVIIRPTVIGSTLEDPFPGWIQGNRMLDPLILSYGKGNLPSFLVNPEAVIDMIPVDMVVNAIIAAMAKHGIAGKPGIKVYHVGSSAVNPLPLGDLFKYSYEHFICSPINMDTEGKTVDMKEMKFFSSMDDFSSHMQTEIVYQPYMFFRGRFRLDVENVDWEDYITNIHIPGLKKHVMKGRGMPK
ncbi:hypothetical protein AAG906_039663 [Vitis piasezkii]